MFTVSPMAFSAEERDLQKTHKTMDSSDAMG